MLDGYTIPNISPDAYSETWNFNRYKEAHAAYHEFGHYTGWCPFCGIPVSDNTHVGSQIAP